MPPSLSLVEPSPALGVIDAAPDESRTASSPSARSVAVFPSPGDRVVGSLTERTVFSYIVRIPPWPDGCERLPSRGAKQDGTNLNHWPRIMTGVTALLYQTEPNSRPGIRTSRAVEVARRAAALAANMIQWEKPCARQITDRAGGAVMSGRYERQWQARQGRHQMVGTYT